MIPIDTSMKRCAAMFHGAPVRGMRTMIVKVTLAYR